MNKLTKEQAIIITGFTGVTCCPFNNFHRDVEIRMQRPVFAHEFASKDFVHNIKMMYKADFIALCS